ncbi:MAG: 50S ribosomal protein L9 [Dehalococcoidales bacterium]|nr:50S ribosomal protein L9 [Dehalococcoidales bacterium]
MKVIFTADVPNVGKSGQLKDVADGYARNYLIPRKLAVMATAGSLNAMATKIEARAKSAAREEADNKEMAEHLGGREIFVEAKSGGKDRLYGSVTNVDIAAALEEATGYAVDKRKIKIPEAIHQLGSYNVEIRLAKDLAPVIKVTVTEKQEE